MNSADGEIIDLGLVGEVTHVEPQIIMSLEKEGFIPVISPVGGGTKGETLNINADYVAASVASALLAEKMILLTDVPGIIDRRKGRYRHSGALRSGSSFMTGQ